MKINKEYLVTDTKKHGGKRKKPIRVLIPHHNAGVVSGLDLAKYMKSTTRQLSANYVIGQQGEVFNTLDESLEPYTTGNRAIDTEAITFEIANSGGAPSWEITTESFNALVELSIDICKRNGIKSVNYTGDKTGNIHLHEWYQNTNCPGPHVKGLMPEYAKRVNAGLKVTVEKPVQKHAKKVGDAVTFTKLSTQANGGKVVNAAIKHGTITKIYEGAQYPYLIGSNIGFVNDAMIASPAVTPKPEPKPPTKPKPTTKPKLSTYEIAVKVNNGDYGDGADRVKRLTAEGYDYNTVRAEVNRIRGLAAQAARPTYRVGDKVRVINPIQYNGGRFVLYRDTYDVLEVVGDRIVIGAGNVVTAAINAANIKKA